MQLSDIRVFEVYSLRSRLKIDVKHCIVAEIVATEHTQFMVAECPAIDTQILMRLRYYEHVMN